MRRALLILLSACFSAKARAQVDFADDFETGDFSRWATVRPVNPGGSLQVAGAAAHRGSFGFRTVDGYTDAGSGSDGALSNPLATDGGVRDVWMRSWVRPVSSNASYPSTSPNLMKLYGYTAVLTLVEIYLDNDALQFQRFDGNSNNAGNAATRGIDAGAWALVELAALGVGAADGGGYLYIDGDLVGSLTGIDWSGVILRNQLFGQGWGDYAFLGTVDYDDARVSASPPASRIQLGVPSSAVSGECVPVSVSLVASNGAPAQAPYAFDVAISNDAGPLQLLASDCASPVPGVHVDVDASSGGAWVRLAEGGQLLSAQHLDFLSGGASLAVGAGPDAGLPQLLAVSCDCSSTAAMPLAISLALAVGWRRSRRSRRGAPSATAGA